MQLPSGTFLNQGSTYPISAVTPDPQIDLHVKPRLCVALDYLWIMWTLSKYQQSENPVEFHNQYVDSQIAKKRTFPDYFTIRLGKKILALDCIAEINFWIFLEGSESDAWEKISMTLSTDVPPGISPENCNFSLRFADNEQKQRLDTIMKSAPLNSSQRMFCEVGLKNPKGSAVQHYNSKDTWYSPLTTSLYGGRWNVRRPESAIGEIPDWSWLYKMNNKKYLDPKSM